MERLDALLKPLAESRVELDDLRSPEKLFSRRPLEQAGIRPEAEALLHELIGAYASGDDPLRSAVRDLFKRFSHFAWAAVLPRDTSTAEGFRVHLIHFSMIDQGPDPRDARLWLDDLINSASCKGVLVGPILREVAQMSSREDRHSWGSTRDWLLRAADQR